MSGTPRVAVVTFPGSNGDRDAVHALGEDLGYEAEMIDYRETNLDRFDAVVLPGGFSYGDALRCGAIARFSPAMPAIRDVAATGRLVLGICNGFQILCEAHLLPGALLRNRSLRFHCFWTHIRIEQNTSAWTNELDIGQVLRLPVAHGEGAYFIDETGLASLKKNNQIVARYVSGTGNLDPMTNPNGSIESIAAVCNVQGNVMGLMPHPERATSDLTGGAEGRLLLRHIAAHATAAVTA